MKIVINKCYGGFSLSPLAVKRMAELQGKPCHFFKSNSGSMYERIPVEIPSNDTFLWSAFTVPNPDEVGISQKNWSEMTDDQKRLSNESWEKITLEQRPEDRSDPVLIKVVEELGEKANGRCAELSVVEIPDGVDWEISEYDGMEYIAEKHRTWA